MICEICKAEGKKSKIKHWRTTEISESNPRSQVFYDEDGNYHHHSLQIHKTEYRCTNQHLFEVISEGRTCLVASCSQAPDWVLRAAFGGSSINRTATQMNNNWEGTPTPRTKEPDDVQEP